MIDDRRDTLSHYWIDDRSHWSRGRGAQFIDTQTNGVLRDVHISVGLSGYETTDWRMGSGSHERRRSEGERMELGPDLKGERLVFDDVAGEWLRGDGSTATSAKLVEFGRRFGLHNAQRLRPSVRAWGVNQ
jgi:hypothetical protein